MNGYTLGRGQAPRKQQEHIVQDRGLHQQQRRGQPGGCSGEEGHVGASRDGESTIRLSFPFLFFSFLFFSFLLLCSVVSLSTATFTPISASISSHLSHNKHSRTHIHIYIHIHINIHARPQQSCPRQAMTAGPGVARTGEDRSMGLKVEFRDISVL